MPLDSIADLERRIRRLEMELDQYKHKFVAPDRTVKTEPPLAHIDHGSLAGLGDDDHPQYRKVADTIDHGALTGLSDDDHPQYLLRTDKAADSDKLDGVDITAFKGLNSLADPDADRVLFWDDSAGALKWLTVGNGLLLSGTTLTANLGQWTSFTPTYTGWTSETVTGIFKYSVIGNIVFLLIDMTAGTSNATNAYIDLPVDADLNASYGGALGMAMDNGTVLSVAAKWYIGGSNQEISFNSNMSNGAWTASGTKRVRCLAIYAKGT